MLDLIRQDAEPKQRSASRRVCCRSRDKPPHRAAGGPRASDRGSDRPAQGARRPVVAALTSTRSCFCRLACAPRSTPSSTVSTGPWRTSGSSSPPGAASRRRISRETCTPTSTTPPSATSSGFPPASTPRPSANRRYSDRYARPRRSPAGRGRRGPCSAPPSGTLSRSENVPAPRPRFLEGTTSLSHAAVRAAQASASEAWKESKHWCWAQVKWADKLPGPSLEHPVRCPSCVSNRTRSRCGAPRRTAVSGRAVPWEQVAGALVEADVVACATPPRPARSGLRKIGSALGQRDGRPLLLVDLAVPRNIDPVVGTLSGITLLDMDDMSKFVAGPGWRSDKRKSRRANGSSPRKSTATAHRSLHAQ